MHIGIIHDCMGRGDGGAPGSGMWVLLGWLTLLLFHFSFTVYRGALSLINLFCFFTYLSYTDSII